MSAAMSVAPASALPILLCLPFIPCMPRYAASRSSDWENLVRPILISHLDLRDRSRLLARGTNMRVRPDKQFLLQGFDIGLCA